MQLDSVNGGSGEEERLLEQYLEKTFRKTASLMAYSCQAVSRLQLRVLCRICICNFIVYTPRLH